MSILGHIAKAPITLPKEYALHTAASYTVHKMTGKPRGHQFKDAAPTAVAVRRTAPAAARRAAAEARYSGAFGGAQAPASWSAAQIDKAVKGGTVANLRKQAMDRGIAGAKGMSRAELVSQLYGPSQQTTAAVGRGGNFMRRVGEVVANLPLGRIGIAAGATHAFNQIGTRDPVQDNANAYHSAARNVGIQAAGLGAKFLGFNPKLVDAATFGATLLGNALQSAAADKQSRLRGFGRGIVESLDVTGYTGTSHLVGAYNSKFGNKENFGERKMREMVEGTGKGNFAFPPTPMFGWQFRWNPRDGARVVTDPHNDPANDPGWKKDAAPAPSAPPSGWTPWSGKPLAPLPPGHDPKSYRPGKQSTLDIPRTGSQLGAAVTAAKRGSYAQAKAGPSDRSTYIRADQTAGAQLTRAQQEEYKRRIYA